MFPEMYLIYNFGMGSKQCDDWEFIHLHSCSHSFLDDCIQWHETLVILLHTQSCDPMGFRAVY